MDANLWHNITLLVHTYDTHAIRIFKAHLEALVGINRGPCTGKKHMYCCYRMLRPGAATHWLPDRCADWPCDHCAAELMPFNPADCTDVDNYSFASI
jgi:hypothetical protein